MRPVCANRSGAVTTFGAGNASLPPSWRNPPPDGALPLTRTAPFYPIPSAAGLGHDQALFTALGSDDLTATRTANLAAWPLDTRSPATFRNAIEPQRALLHHALGPLPDGPAKTLTRQTIALPTPHCAGGPATAERLTITSRWPGVNLTAYLVQPPTDTDNGRAVVALHGHGSSPERLLGLEAEDYGRLLALRLACAGYAVIVPAVTSNSTANNAISARLALEGGTLYGLMVSQVLSSVDFLQTEYPDRPVGLYGISNGGLLALFSNAVDERPEFVVAESILTPYWDNILMPTVSQSSRTDYFFYFNAPLWLDLDMAGLALLSLPDTLLFTVGALDAERAGWQTQWTPIQTNYAAVGLAEQTDLILFHGYHELAEDLAINRLNEMLP